ncbi:MAG: metallophosphoesterase [Brevibacterium sp.]|uniref:metallophosphoesterase n=1 Tax=Brevibacterium aurantiacum TaxID=273384 RepID=UPI003F8F21BA
MFTADLHLGHKLVSELRGFNSTAEHDSFIMDNLQSSVRKDDILWVLGDYAVSQHEHARSLLRSVHCRRILIPGNHDPEHPMHRGAWNRQLDALETFDAVLPYQRIRLNKINFLMSHLPYEGDHKDVDRYDEYRLPSKGMPLLCGHVHEEWKHKQNQLNVGVDVNDFRPVTANEVVEWWKTESQIERDEA